MQTENAKTEQEAKDMIDADWVRGTVFLKSADKVVRLFEKCSGSDLLQVAGSASTAGLDFDFEGNVETVNKSA